MVIRKEPGILTLCGDTGTAKTHTLKKLAQYFRLIGLGLNDRRVWKNPPAISFIEWSEVATEDRTDEDLLFTEAIECDILLLDDIGSEIDKFKTNEPRERLRKLLGSREDKITIVTTNIPKENWSRVWDARVEDRLLRGNAVVVDLFNIPRFTEVQ